MSNVNVAAYGQSGSVAYVSNLANAAYDVVDALLLYPFRKFEFEIKDERSRQVSVRGMIDSKKLCWITGNYGSASSTTTAKPSSIVQTARLD